MKEEQVVCHASTLALMMTDEARREAEMYEMENLAAFDWSTGVSTAIFLSI